MQISHPTFNILISKSHEYIDQCILYKYNNLHTDNPAVCTCRENWVTKFGDKQLDQHCGQWWTNRLHLIVLTITWRKQLQSTIKYMYLYFFETVWIEWSCGSVTQCFTTLEPSKNFQHYFEILECRSFTTKKQVRHSISEKATFETICWRICIAYKIETLQ